MILLDTHSLIWFINDPKKLSPKAQKVISAQIKKGFLMVSSISVWEIYMLVKKERLKLEIDTDLWLKKVESLPFIQFIPIDNAIAAKSVNLEGKLNSDPADRVIVATAMQLGAVLVTADQRIRKYPLIQTIW